MKALFLFFIALSLFGSDYNAMREAFDKGDVERAISFTRYNAINGVVPAIYDLGLLYYSKGSIKEAKTWLERSVEKGGQGQLGLSIILFEKSQNTRQYNEVIDSLENVQRGSIRDALIAVSQDFISNKTNALAQEYLLLGELFSGDKIIYPNNTLAFLLIKKAAKKGNIQALELMGDAYNTMVTSYVIAPRSQNTLDIALEYYAKAGTLDAMAKIGQLYLIGPRYINTRGDGFALILKSAQLGSILGAKMAGDYYARGQGVTANAKEAYKWYLKARKICEVNNIIATNYTLGKESLSYQKAYKVCHNKALKKEEYHLLFEVY